MLVLDIVNRAAMQSGVVPSFNPDEVPEDIQARGADILRHEIIPSMNCDRTLDITEVVQVFTPFHGVVDLVTTPLDYPREIYGTVPVHSSDLLKVMHTTYMGQDVEYYPNVRTLLENMGLTSGASSPFQLNVTPKWPTDFVGNPRDIAIWTEDLKLVEIDYGNQCSLNGASINPTYNVPFAPMRVDEVFRASDGAPLQYVHAGEFVSSEFRYAQLIFASEDYVGKLRLRFTPSFGSTPVMVVLPMPLKIVNSYQEPHPWQGDIEAPEKFRSYLVSQLAYRLAIEYGVSTAPAMLDLATKAYQSLLKNQSKHDHPQDISRKICHYLGRNRGWRTGSNGNGYAGGFNG